MTFDGGAQWNQIFSPGMELPIHQYARGRGKTFKFELYVNSRHNAPLNMADVLTKLMKYRDSKERLLFAYGSFVTYVVIIEAPINIKAWTNNLVITHATIPITLSVA